MEYKRYGAFSKKNGVYLGSQLFSETPTLEAMGFTEENAQLEEIAENIDFSSCKYNSKKKCIVPIDHEECDKLIQEHLVSVENAK